MPLVEERIYPWTEQEALNAAWAWTENHGPCMEGKNCLYRSIAGDNCCFVGLLLPDRLAKELGLIDIEGVIEEYPEIAEYLEDLDFSFLVSLQEAHDDVYSSYDYKTSARQKLSIVACKYGLEVPK